MRAECDEMFIAMRATTEREADLCRQRLFTEAEKLALREEGVKLRAELAAVRAECDELFIKLEPLEARRADADEVASLSKANGELQAYQRQTAAELRLARAEILELQRSRFATEQELLASRLECDRSIIRAEAAADELRSVRCRTHAQAQQRAGLLAKELDGMLLAMDKISADFDILQQKLCSREVSKATQDHSDLSKRCDDAHHALRMSEAKLAEVEGENCALREHSLRDAELLQQSNVELQTARVECEDALHALRVSEAKLAEVEGENLALLNRGDLKEAIAITPDDSAAMMFSEDMSREELISAIVRLLEERNDAGLAVHQLPTSMELMSSAGLLEELWKLHLQNEQDNLALLAECSAIWGESQGQSAADDGENSPVTQLLREGSAEPLVEILPQDARIGELEESVRRLEALLCLRNDEIIRQDSEIAAGQLMRDQVDALARAISACDAGEFEQQLHALTGIPVPQEMWVDPAVLSNLQRRVEAYEHERELAEAFLGQLLEPGNPSQDIDAQAVSRVPDEIGAAAQLLSSELGGRWFTANEIDPGELDELDAAKQLLSSVVGGCWLTRNGLFVASHSGEHAGEIEAESLTCDAPAVESERRIVDGGVGSGDRSGATVSDEQQVPHIASAHPLLDPSCVPTVDEPIESAFTSVTVGSAPALGAISSSTFLGIDDEVVPEASDRGLALLTTPQLASGAGAALECAQSFFADARQQIFDSSELVWLVLTPVITEARADAVHTQSWQWVERAWPLRRVSRRWKRTVEAVVCALQFSPQAAMRVCSRFASCRLASHKSCLTPLAPLAQLYLARS